MHDPPHQPSARNRAADPRQVSRQLPILLEHHNPVDCQLGPQAAELTFYGRVGEVRVDAAGPPRDGPLVPGAVEGACQCEAGIHDYEGIHIR